MSGVYTAMTVLSLAGSVYSANKTSKATMKAARMQNEASKDALRQQQQEMNQTNQRHADTESILEGNTSGDVPATMLTPGGATMSLDDLILGRGTSLLGGRQ